MVDKKIIEEIADNLSKLNQKINKKKGLNYRDRHILKEMERINRLFSGDPEPSPYVTVDFVNRILKVSKVSLLNWRKEGFPESENKILRAESVLVWLRNKWVGVREGLKKEFNQRMSDEDFKKKKADRILSELKIAEIEKRLVDRNSFERVYREYMSTISKMIQDFEKKLARFVSKSERSDFMKEAKREIDIVLNTLADMGE